MTPDYYEINVTFKVDDSVLLEAKELLEQTRSAISDLVFYIFSPKKIKKEFVPFLIILFRMRETVSSIELLTFAKRERDASILMLTLMELEFDALYMANDLARTETWIKHDKRHTKPWKVNDLIQKVFTNKGEQEAATELYRTCSMVKHGNPFGASESFPLGIKDNCVVLPSKCDPKISTNYMLWGCTECINVAIASIKVFEREGIDTAKFEERFKDLDQLRAKIFKANIIAMLGQIGKGRASQEKEKNGTDLSPSQ